MGCLQVTATRLNKYLSEAGICSRREADRWIEAGKVTIDGKVAEVGTKVLPEQKVMVNGKPVALRQHVVVLAVNKPIGIVCTEEKKEKNNIIKFLNYPERITYIGRLDKDSEGLLLMTNHGDIINKMMRGGNYHEKEYEVTVDKPVSSGFLKRMSEGVSILDTITRPCEIEKMSKYRFWIILTQGLNRQIRRMCEALGYQVKALKRVRVMNIVLGDLKVGTYRNLTEQEMKQLLEQIQNSSNETVISP
ncbi:MAG: 23S rRNA pseudouridine(2604) synthase RluF [Acetivibrio sp.]